MWDNFISTYKQRIVAEIASAVSELCLNRAMPVQFGATALTACYGGFNNHCHVMAARGFLPFEISEGWSDKTVAWFCVRFWRIWITTRALIADDHPVIRGALVSSLLSLGVIDDVCTADCFGELIDMLEQDDSYQLLILDLSMTDVSGSRGVAYVREHHPDIPIMVFSGNDSADIVAECFEYGVHGFVSKSTSMQILVNAIRIVLAGNVYIPPSAARLMGFEPLESQQVPSGTPGAAVRFTPKQQQVFDQLMLGVPNKIIARRLDMAEGTVKTHLHGIYQVLGVHNRAQAILKSRQLHLID